MNRSNTSSQSEFELPMPDKAKLLFAADNRRVKISIPRGSHWDMPPHWHTSDEAECISLVGLQSRIIISTAQTYGSGSRTPSPGPDPYYFVHGKRISWMAVETDRRVWACEANWAVELEVPDQGLYRNMASAIMDKDLYPHLSTTPIWIKGIFTILRIAPPAASDRLLTALLWIQLQMTMYHHDFHKYYSYIPFALPWHVQIWAGRAPRWVYDLQNWSMWTITRVVMGSCYWFGRLALGMNGSYAEYTAQAF